MENKNTYKNPYPGIRSFNIEESHLFFGRERQINDIFALLQNNHFAAISGSSGSGKSSIIKAGIIPKFLSEHENAEYIIFRPGDNPIKNLSQSLDFLFQKQEFDRKIIKQHLSQINKSPIGLEQTFVYFSQNKPLLVYIDQFEEIFRYRNNEQIANSEYLADIFIKNIINVVNSKKIKIFIALSLRSDFLSDCAIFEGLPDLINKGHYLLPSLTDLEKEQAIVKPAEQAGATFDHKLLELIRQHSRDPKISLPVLQHALMRTWDYWLLNAPHGTPITIEHYEAIGTVYKALSIHAETIYNSLNDNQKFLTEKIFRALTFLGDNEHGVRSPQKLSDLCEITEAKELEVIEIIEKFRAKGNSFLQPPPDVLINRNTVIDISHESIMISWDRLVEWVEKETNSAQLYMRLSKTAELYQAGKTGVLVNPDLQIAVNWLKTDKPNTAWARRYDPAFDRVVNFIHYSQKEYEKNIAAQKAKQERSLKRSRIIAAILGIAALISIFFMIIALNLKFKAQQSEKEALEKKELAEKQSEIAEQRRKEAIALQLIAKQQQDIAEQNRLIAEQQKQYAVEQQKEALYQKMQAINARNQAIVARDLAVKLQIEAEQLRDEALKQKLIIEQEKQRAELSEARTDTLRRLDIAKKLAIQANKMFFDNQKAEKIDDYQKKLPDILVLQAYYFNKKNHGNPLDPDIFSALLNISQQTTTIEKTFDNAVRNIVFIANSDYFIAAADDGNIYKINYISPESKQKFTTNSYAKYEYRALAVSPDGNTAIAGTKSGKILAWNINNNQEKPLTYSSKQIITALYFIDNQTIVSGDNQGNVSIFSVNNISLNIQKTINLHSKIVGIGQINSSVIIGLENGTIKFLNKNLEQTNEIKTGYGKLSILKTIDNKIYVGHTNGLLQIFDTNGNEINKWFAHNSGITGIVLNPANNTLITSGYDKSIKIWNLQSTTSQPIIINAHNVWVYSIAISTDNKHLISGDANGNIKITTIDIELMKNSLKNKVNQNMTNEDWIKFVGEDIEYNKNLPEDL